MQSIKKHIFLLFTVFLIASCSRTTKTEEPITIINYTTLPRNVFFSSKNYIPQKKPVYVEKVNNKTLDYLQSLRGMNSQKVYDSLEKTTYTNPIKGYNQISETELNAPNYTKQTGIHIKSTPIIAPKKPVYTYIRPETNTKVVIVKKKKDIKIPDTKPVFIEKNDLKIKALPVKTIKIKSLVGSSKDEILKTLQRPNKILHNNQSDTWLYRNNVCKAQLYFFKGEVIYIDTQFYDIDFDDSDTCIKTFGLY